MTIQLRPELEEIIRRDVERGLYASPKEYLERAVAMLHGQEEWIAANREKIRQQIEEGWQASENGPMYDAEEVEAWLDEKTREWFAQNRRSA